MFGSRTVGFGLVILLILLTGGNPPVGSAAEGQLSADAFSGDTYQTDEPIFRFPETGIPGARRTQRTYPADPVSDIQWSAGMTGVSDIQTAFNTARKEENIQLGTDIPMMTLPSQSQWDALTDGEKMLWLINRERIDRGVDPLHGLEINVASVAQYYADYLLDNDKWGHYEDGRDPWERLDGNPKIGACRDFLSVAENLAVFMTTGSSIPLPIERSVYLWMYDDGTCCAWGHRHAILWYPYNDNGGTPDMEGFLGVGRASGAYTDWDLKDWNYAEMIVMNVFDPCSAWDYSAETLAGDINGIAGLDLGDAILVLQILAGMTGFTVNLDGEISGDFRIGLEEALYVLRVLAQ